MRFVNWLSDLHLSLNPLSDPYLNLPGNLVLITTTVQTCHTPTNHSGVWKPVDPAALPSLDSNDRRVPAHFQWLIFSLVLFHTHDRETHSYTHTRTRTLGSVHKTRAITFVVDLIVVQNRHCQMEKDVNAEAFITMQTYRIGKG